MSKIQATISMSLDGYITGPNDSVELGLGEGGERLHEWVYELESWRSRHNLEGGTANEDSASFDEVWGAQGAIIMGKRMFLHGEGPWGPEPPFHMPVFVLTHEPREPLTKHDTTFTFVTDGIESAIRQARAAAGAKNVGVSGGAQAIQQCLAAGLLDELQIDLVPIMLGGGVRLFDNLQPEQVALEIINVTNSPGVTHLLYRVQKPGQADI